MQRSESLIFNLYYSLFFIKTPLLLSRSMRLKHWYQEIESNQRADFFFQLQFGPLR
jgi:hypothetical protein